MAVPLTASPRRAAHQSPERDVGGALGGRGHSASAGPFGTPLASPFGSSSSVPFSAGKGYLVGGIYWFATSFSLATGLGLASTELMLAISAGKAGLIPPAVANHLLGEAGFALILVMICMVIVPTRSAIKC